MIKLICFDLDGVLVDACDWHRITFCRALKEVTDVDISYEYHQKTLNGLPTLEKLKILNIPSEFVKEVSDRKQRYTVDLVSSLTTDNQKISMLSKLKSKGIMLACVTNSIRLTTEIMLKNTGMFEWFDRIITNQDIANPKPCSEGYITAMVSLNKFPKDTLIVEDSPKGILSAKNTGAKVLEVSNPSEVTFESIEPLL